MMKDFEMVCSFSHEKELILEQAENHVAQNIALFAIKVQYNFIIINLIAIINHLCYFILMFSQFYDQKNFFRYIGGIDAAQKNHGCFDA